MLPHALRPPSARSQPLLTSGPSGPAGPQASRAGPGRPAPPRSPPPSSASGLVSASFLPPGLEEHPQTPPPPSRLASVGRRRGCQESISPPVLHRRGWLWVQADFSLLTCASGLSPPSFSAAFSPSGAAAPLASGGGGEEVSSAGASACSLSSACSPGSSLLPSAGPSSSSWKQADTTSEESPAGPVDQDWLCFEGLIAHDTA